MERRSSVGRPKGAGATPAVVAIALLLWGSTVGSAAAGLSVAKGGEPRGTVMAATEVARFTAGQIDDAVGREMDVVGPAACDVTVIDLRYVTVGVHGEPADASAVLLLPGGAPGCGSDVPLLGWGRGTETRRAATLAEQAAGVANSPFTAFYAAKGYAVVATDYLGLGRSSYPFHPYLHAGSEASAIIDALRAARGVARTRGFPLSQHILLAGYSQGGHAAMAAQRVIERHHADEFDLVASAPMAGPYDLPRIVGDGWIGRPGAEPLTSILLSYMLVSYQRVYGDLYGRSEELFRQPFAAQVEALFPGPFGVFEMAGQPPFAGGADLDALRTPDFVRAVAQRGDHPFLKALRRNDLLAAGWSPRTPTLLCGARRDALVPFDSTLRAAAAFQGAPVSVMDVDSRIPTDVNGVEAHAGWGAYLCYDAARRNLFEPVLGRGRQLGVGQ